MKLDYGAPVRLAAGELEVKATKEGDWEVEGYASTFNNVDLGHDVILPGAFDKTLKEKPLRQIKFLHSHLPWEVLGVPKELRVDDRGLFGRFKISKTALGTDTHTLVLDGALDSFSIGYKAKDYDFADAGDVRQIKEVELFEISLVAMPMNPQAVVTSAKALDAFTLTEQMGIARDYLAASLAEARELVAKHGTLNDVKRQELEELFATFADFDHEFKTLLESQPKSSLNLHLQLELAKARQRLRERGDLP